MMLPQGTPGGTAGSAPASGLAHQPDKINATMPADTGRWVIGDNASPSVSILIGHQDRIGSRGQNKAVSIPL
jgi:hypothetical protein